MGYTDWANKKVKKMDWKDIGLVKLAVFFFALWVANLWSGILALAWYWYGIIFILAAIGPTLKLFGK